MKQPQVELLAPASGLEAIRGAIYAGADAVYTGGSRFGARAYADNLSEEDLLEAIDFVHLYGKRLYLTVNTLLKEKELEDVLVKYLLPYYRQGLDAVIVQDIGVFRKVREHFPDLPVHVSTQAVVTGRNSAKYWEEAGAERIVTARELSLEEIRTIRKSTSLEIESFVHGALCYCYSGQCFFSSFIGGRSGNRGRCAQPCRLPYQLLDENGRIISGGQEKSPYLLSPKDMCTLDILPDIIEAGVFSLKIEGRMKRPEYTAGVTEIYRKYIDLYLKYKADGEKTGHQKDILPYIKEHYHVSQSDKERLMDLYNRGNFHSGYYLLSEADNSRKDGIVSSMGREMMSMERPNHNGIYAGTLRKGKKGYSMKAETDLHQKDVLEFRGILDKQRKDKPLELVLERDVARNTVYALPDKYAFLMGKRQSVEVYRTKNEQLLQQLHKKYLEESLQLDISGRIVVEEGSPLVLTVCRGEKQPSESGSGAITVRGEVVASAQNQPVQEEYIRKQLCKTGQTPFRFKQLEVFLKGSCFVPVKALNQLRREALEQLEAAMTEVYRRTLMKENKAEAVIAGEMEPLRVSRSSGNSSMKPSGDSIPKCHVMIENLKHLQLLTQYTQIDAIYISVHAFLFLQGKLHQEALQQLKQAKEQCHAAGMELCLVFPHIWRKSMEDKLAPCMKEILKEIDGIVVKNLEALTFVNLYHPQVKVVLDYTAYAMNTEAVQSWKEASATMLTLPVELNKGELMVLASDKTLPWEMVVYGHLPMMISAQCPVKNTVGCQKKPMLTQLKDRKGSCHYVKNYCDACYSVIYNSEPLVLLDLEEELKKMPLYAVRLQFTVESEEEIRQIMEKRFERNYTRGHWKRGVE